MIYTFYWSVWNTICFPLSGTNKVGLFVTLPLKMFWEMIIGTVLSWSKKIKLPPSLNLVLINLRKCEFKHSFQDTPNPISLLWLDLKQNMYFRFHWSSSKSEICILTITWLKLIFFILTKALLRGSKCINEVSNRSAF